MKIKTSDLISVLQIVKPGLANKDIIEQTDCFAFSEGRVFTYNDEISVSAPLDEVDLTGAVPADVLFNFLSRAKTAEIELESTETELKLKAGRARAGIPFQSEIRIPIEEVADELEAMDEWKDLPTNFIEAVSFSLFACSRDMSRPVLTCLNVRKDGKIDASDAYRVVQYRLMEEMPVETFLLPASAAREVIALRPTGIHKTKGWAHFVNEDNVVMSCRIFSENFPQVEGILEMEDAQEVTLPANLSDILDKARVFSKKEDAVTETVEIRTEGRKLYVEAKTPSGWFSDWCGLEAPHDFSFRVNPEFLQSALKHLTACSIIPGAKMSFQGEAWTLIIALQRLGK